MRLNTTNKPAEAFLKLPFQEKSKVRIHHKLPFFFDSGVRNLDPVSLRGTNMITDMHLDTKKQSCKRVF